MPIFSFSESPLEHAENTRKVKGLFIVKLYNEIPYARWTVLSHCSFFRATDWGSHRGSILTLHTKACCSWGWNPITFLFANYYGTISQHGSSYGVNKKVKCILQFSTVNFRLKNNFRWANMLTCI